ncbi:riboflavin synthase [bacterium]|nr:riboflavin synthase [bacterium]
MFSGIVEETGKVKGIVKRGDVVELRIEAEKVIDDLKEGDSISVNGVCLTVEKIENKKFYVSLTHQTLRDTDLGKLKIGENVNLERSLKLSDRIGGHFLTGHIDFVSRVISIEKRGNSGILKFSIPQEFRKYIVKKGSIGVEGISLTVSEIKNGIVSISLIPFTLQNTNLKDKKNGSYLNIEVDMMAKYIENFIKERIR